MDVQLALDTTIVGDFVDCKTECEAIEIPPDYHKGAPAYGARRFAPGRQWFTVTFTPGGAALTYVIGESYHIALLHPDGQVITHADGILYNAANDGMHVIWTFLMKDAS